jgi:ribulose 1,5-bisphosphate synthetase/thiazole synthase
MAGLSAAMTAIATGATVAVVEKQATLGGSAALSAGMLFVSVAVRLPLQSLLICS